MQKKTYNDVQLNCVFQHVTDLPDELCLTGVISRNEGGFRFEEEIKKGRAPRNPNSTTASMSRWCGWSTANIRCTPKPCVWSPASTPPPSPSDSIMMFGRLYLSLNNRLPHRGKPLRYVLLPFQGIETPKELNTLAQGLVPVKTNPTCIMPL